MYFSHTERKFVHVTRSSLWAAAMGAIFERYHNTQQWAVQARTIDKAAAEKFMTGGVIRIDCDDEDVRINFRMRYRQSVVVPDELPETCGKLDSILLVRKRELYEPAEPGYDTRYHFFLVSWLDPVQAAIDFQEARIAPRSTDKGHVSKRKCKPEVDEVFSAEVLAREAKKKRRHQLGMSAARYANRWRG